MSFPVPANRRTLLPGLLLLAASLAAAPARTQDRPRSLEYPVKASLLLNFAKFAEWPEGSLQAASPTVTICVLGSDPFGAVLDTIVAGRTVGGRPVEVRRYRQVEGVESCHALFIASSASGIFAQALATIGRSPVLSVGESLDFGERGGIITLLIEDNRARFSVNLAPTELSGLKLSSKLLGVARSVRVGANQ